MCNALLSKFQSSSILADSRAKRLKGISALSIVDLIIEADVDLQLVADDERGELYLLMRTQVRCHVRAKRQDLEVEGLPRTTTPRQRVTPLQLKWFLARWMRMLREQDD